MENRLIKKYGLCVIPKGTLLYRGAEQENKEDIMFFGTKYFIAKAFNKKVQIWQTTEEIKVYFFIKYLNQRGWVISSLSDVYKWFVTKEKKSTIDSLEIKMDVEKRNTLTQKLTTYNCVNGWFTSLEDKEEIEIALFNVLANPNIIKLKEVTIDKNSSYYKDSLMKIQIYPSDLFYANTKKRLKTNYTTHKKSVREWVKETAKDKQDEQICKHFAYDLRDKLKI